MDFTTRENRPFSTSEEQMPDREPMVCEGFPLAKGCTTMLVADPGASKTTTACRLALSMASRKLFFGSKIEYNGGRILHFDGNEMGYHQLDRKYNRIANWLNIKVSDKIRFEKGAFAIDKLNDREFQSYIDYCKSEPTELMIYDSLPRFKSNDIALNTGEMSFIMGRFKSLAEEVDCPILLLHHFARTHQAGGTGSLQIAAGADVELHLTKKGEELKETFTIETNHMTKNRFADITGLIKISYKLIDCGERSKKLKWTKLAFEEVLNLEQNLEKAFIKTIFEALPSEEENYAYPTNVFNKIGETDYDRFIAGWEKMVASNMDKLLTQPGRTKGSIKYARRI